MHESHQEEHFKQWAYQKQSYNQTVVTQRSKMVGCPVTMDTSFVQFLNREYRMVYKVTLLNSMCVVP